MVGPDAASQFTNGGNEEIFGDTHVRAAAQRAGSSEGHPPRILIVGDEETGIHCLEGILGRVLRAEFRATTDPGAATRSFVQFQPDLILLDLSMPDADGFALLHLVKGRIPPDTYLPIVALTAETSPAARQQILAGGATDFLTKPFDPAEVQLRITNLLKSRAVYLESERRTREARAGARELRSAHLETVERLALAIEYREDGTGGHTRRVGEWSAVIAHALGLPEATIMEIRLAAPLHDVGKIAIPDRILLKPARLSLEEWRVMQAHTTEGARIVAGGRCSLLLTAEAIALNHHERWDGTGYPRGLGAEAIPLPARVVAVADAFDAMTHPRPYRQALPEGEALAELQRNAGSQFDPQCVEHFLQLTGRPTAAAKLPVSVS
jgi:putative two-component system response regulator